jgi:hypothetical protein
MRENVTSTVTVNHAYPSGTHDRSSFDGEPRFVRRPPELPPTGFDGDPKLDKRASELPPTSFDGDPKLDKRAPELPPTRSFDGDPKLDKRAPELPPSSAIAHSERKDGGRMGGVAGCGDGEGEAE